MEPAHFYRSSCFFIAGNEQSVKILRHIAVFFLARCRISQCSCTAVGDIAELYLSARRKGRNTYIPDRLFGIVGDGIADIGILTAVLPFSACSDIRRKVLIPDIIALNCDLAFCKSLRFSRPDYDIVIILFGVFIFVLVFVFIIGFGVIVS